MPNPVPEMTWVQKQAWIQPSPEMFDWDTVPGHVIVSKTQFSMLLDYSRSNPTSVYEGKMWRREGGGVHYLVWYGESSEPNQCSINHKPILLKETVDLLKGESNV